MIREDIFKLTGNKHNVARGYRVLAAAKDLPNKHKESKSKIDTQNRKEVVMKIIQYVKEGMTQEQAIDKIIKEEKELVKKFEYLTQNGLDLKVCFNNWVKNSDLLLMQKSEKERNER